MLVASVNVPEVSVPAGYAHDGLITLNISDQAVQGLTVDQHMVSFSARFGGRHFNVRLPLESLRAMFAREDPKASAVSLSEAAAEIAARRADEREQGSLEGGRGNKEPKAAKLRLVE